MPVSSQMKDALGCNATFLIELWRMKARTGAEVAFSSCGRDVVYGGVTYKGIRPCEPSRPTRKLGLEPDTAELFGALDNPNDSDAVITEASVQAKVWARARVVKYTVSLFDPATISTTWWNFDAGLALGYALRQSGYIGEIRTDNGTFTAEFISIEAALGQDIGDVTSPLDRRRRVDQLAGVSEAAHRHSTTVGSFTDRRTFRVGYAQPEPNFFRYGLARWTSGANSGTGQNEMEIKQSVSVAGVTEITLQEPMPSPIANGDGVDLIEGYDGTREMARDRFGEAAVLDFDGEPDLPGLKEALTYPE